MQELLNKKITLTKKGSDGKYQAVAWIQKSDKYPDSLSCSISVERMEALLKSAQGKYVYVSVFVDDAEKKAEATETSKPTVEIETMDEVPF